MITVDSPEVKTNCLMQIIKMVEAGDIQPLLDAGIDPKALDELRAMPSKELHLMVQNKDLQMHLLIEPESMHRAFKTLRAMKLHDGELTYFIQNGATLSMLRKFFPGTSDLVDDFRALLQAQAQQGERRGRTALPDSSNERDAIHREWSAIAKAAINQRVTRGGLIALHKTFASYDIAALYGVINEFGGAT